MFASWVTNDRLFLFSQYYRKFMMSITTNKKTIALAASAAFTASLALSPTLASAQTANPFASSELSSGYMQLAEGKCGDNMKKDAEAKCGAKMKDKAEHEAKCGDNMKKDAEAKCGAKMKDKAAKMKEGKCGEAKCGANK
jgi:uncharacterized low-complexity protein